MLAHFLNNRRAARVGDLRNSRLPQWAQTELVNIYLFQADSGEQVLSALDVPNPVFEAGIKHFQVNDSWWGSRGNSWSGQNVSFPMYFIITRNDKPLDNSAIPQATFTAVPHSSPTSATISESGSGSLPPGATSTPGTAGSVQGANAGSSFPNRASDAGPFSVADATIMANAFRQALRKPDFADRPVEEGESPDDGGATGGHGAGPGPGHSQLINQELAEEGRDIRSVSSSRGVKVETLSGGDDTDTATVQDH
ncbi:hypothetical protein BN946_scf184915.g30 [Trametes cinnabarina]|uniref:Uncharacterized protein n=1 Tax=Pycnoporus cinnabarinus TaxID=5643 RepID=A0A060SBR7_PYCCI|nr:hypothetical protein BN946_scf184915.g30 [Trametes cinnabarina]